MKTHSIEHQARVLNATPAQVKAGLKRNADSMRCYSDADLKRWGKTRQQAIVIATDYERRAA